jgi:undecaprenyl pyrophosphate phosphatase UppP
MKKLPFLVKFIVAFIVATFAVAFCIRYDASDNVVIMTYFGVGIVTMLVLGAFNVPERKQSNKYTVRHKAGRSYGKAAIFVGTACLFVGTPQECEELADDLWYYAQPVRVDTLTGDETFDIL